MSDDVDVVRKVFARTRELHGEVAEKAEAAIVRAGTTMRAAILAGKKVLVFGNGGSATDALHLSSELVGRFGRHIERGGLPVMALAADVATITSVANDFGYEEVFARQIEALGAEGDVAIALTTSGRSKNVNVALRRALERSMTTIALTGGDGGDSGRLADVHVNVPDASPDRVQEVHRTIVHVLCEIVERDPAVARLKSH